MEVNIKSMLDGIQNVVQRHFRAEKNKVKETMDILNCLPLVIELRAEIEKLKNENQDLKDKIIQCEEKVNIELEIVEMNNVLSLEKPLEKSISQYFTGSCDSDHSSNVKSSNEDEDEDASHDDTGDDEDENDEDDNSDDEDDNEDDNENEFDDDPFGNDTYIDTVSRPIEIGYTLIDENLIVVRRENSPTHTHSIDGMGLSQSREMQVYKISVDDTNYYISDKLNGDIYNINITGCVGTKAGRLENGNVFFS